jgi:hypothetical protein
VSKALLRIRLLFSLPTTSTTSTTVSSTPNNVHYFNNSVVHSSSTTKQRRLTATTTTVSSTPLQPQNNVVQQQPQQQAKTIIYPITERIDGKERKWNEHGERIGQQTITTCPDSILTSIETTITVLAAVSFLTKNKH